MSADAGPGRSEGQAGNGINRGRVQHRPAAQRMQQYDASSLLANPARYFDELMQTEVDQQTIDLLKNMFSRELMLGNFDEEDYHEIRLLARNRIEQVLAEHPSSRSTFTGDRRAMLSGDYDNKLKPLSGMQKAWIDQAIFNFMSILSRSREGFQQEMNAKSIHVNEAHRPGSNSSGLRGLIPWGRG